MTPSPRTVLWRIALICLGIRIALELIGVAALALDNQAGWAQGLQMWSHWDATNYLRVAQVGYRAHAVAGQNPDDPLYVGFFPLFPLLARTVSVVFRNLILSGLVVSYMANVFGAWFLYRLVLLDADHDEAWRCVVLLLAFPTAYFLSAPYTESLFIFSVVGAIYLARTDRWPRAGLLGAFATATRVNGVAILPALAVEALDGAPKPREVARRWVWAASASAGLLLFFAVAEIVYHNPFQYFSVQRSHWFQHPVMPWVPIVDAFRGLHRGATGDLLFIFANRLAIIAFLIPVLILATAWLRRADWVYGWAAFLPFLCTSWLTAMPRFVMGFYPVFMVLAKLTRKRFVFVPVVVLFVAIQVAYFMRYAVGRWTF